MDTAYDSRGRRRKLSYDNLGSNQKRLVSWRATKDPSRAVRGMAANEREYLPDGCVFRWLGDGELVAVYFPLR
jgi:hypothetical protein